MYPITDRSRAAWHAQARQHGEITTYGAQPILPDDASVASLESAYDPTQEARQRWSMEPLRVDGPVEAQGLPDRRYRYSINPDGTGQVMRVSPDRELSATEGAFAQQLDETDRQIMYALQARMQRAGWM